MNKFLTPAARALPTAIVFAAVAAFSTGVHADEASKRALAVKLAQLQQKTSSDALARQLTDSALQPALANWLPQVASRVPQDKQQDVNNRLNAELQKFGDSTYKVVQDQATKTAQSALVPVFMDKLSESELNVIVTYLQNPASAKFTALSSDAGNAWAGQIVKASQPAVTGYAKTFDAAATRIVNAAATTPATPATPAPATSAAPTAPATGTRK